MIKVRIKKDNEIIFESNRYGSYDNADFLELDFYNLTDTNLSNVDLGYAILSHANLSHANLYNADLSYADLNNANLSYANLSCADLYSACLINANLSCTRLINADLYNANLVCACLYKANLSDANLSDAILSDAILNNANLDKKEKIRQGIVLDESMIGYKKAVTDGKKVIVTLEIPKNAIVFSINNKKCRTNICKVVDIEGDFNKAYSSYDNKFVYEKGKTIRIKDFNLQYNVECGTGIHFFRTKQEALDYKY